MDLVADLEGGSWQSDAGCGVEGVFGDGFNGFAVDGQMHDDWIFVRPDYNNKVKSK